MVCVETSRESLGRGGRRRKKAQHKSFLRASGACFRAGERPGPDVGRCPPRPMKSDLLASCFELVNHDQTHMSTNRPKP